MSIASQSIEATNRVSAFGTNRAGQPLEPFSIDRRELGSYDLEIEILYCGVCHTDIHFVNNDWGVSNYPLVPGHEILGKISQIGEGVTNLSLIHI